MKLLYAYIVDNMSWFSFFEYLKTYIPLFGNSKDIQCKEAIASLTKRQLSFSKNSSYKPGPPQVDNSYNASTDYCAFIVEKLTPDQLLKVYQYMFDSRPYFLKKKALTVAKNICFSLSVRYSKNPAITPFLAAGVVDSNNTRNPDLTSRHYDSLVTHHVIKRPLLELVNNMFYSLNNNNPRPRHVLLDFRTERVPGANEIALTNVSVSGSNKRKSDQYDYITGPACYNDVQAFIEFLNMLGPHGTAEIIYLNKANEKYKEYYQEEMPLEIIRKIETYNQILISMQQKMIRQFRRHTYNIKIIITQIILDQINNVKIELSKDAAITIIDGIITIKHPDVRNTMQANLQQNFPNCPEDLLEKLMAGTLNMYDVKWPQDFELINWSLISRLNPSGNPKDPKDYMIYVTTTIEDGRPITFNMLNEEVNFMEQSQNSPEINKVRIGGKSKQKNNKQMKTRRKHNKNKKRKYQRKSMKRRK
jgi:hypothetical protein